jgi:uncharacterized 2Fe-2S/4Fe-4S cluster protein (DUF4445 family)
MQHLLLGLDPSPLACPPYAPADTAPARVNAAGIGVRVSEDAVLYMPPCIGGHVGSDITAGLLASEVTRLSGNTLFVDIGTNGEIALCAAGRLRVCSAAAGPAFEGASLCMGMRAETGAIERVAIRNDDVSVETVGGAAPRGICGSGAIDAAAAFLAAGIIDETGRMSTAEELREAGAGEDLCSRVSESDNGRMFALWTEADRLEGFRDDESRVVITQKDIRDVQLGKAAIAAGIKALLREAGIEADVISRVLLAGTFGNNIDVESACRIGLFPGIPLEKIISKGNAAGEGASLILLSEEKRSEAESIARKAEHVALAQTAEFQELLIGEIDF